MDTFAPYGNGIKQSLTSSSVTVPLPTAPSSGPIAIRIAQVQGSTNPVYLALGDSTVTTSLNTGMLTRPYSEPVIVGVANGETHMAILVGAGTATAVIITIGTLI